jgi:release factor glutamine methyltransferase
MKARSKLLAISKDLTAAGIESPDKEAEIILRDALRMDLIDIYRDDPELSDEQMSLLDSFVRRRTRREPLQYILGYVEFMGLKIQVGKGVLIPRPETELMAEYTIRTCRGGVTPPLHVLDLCTGSGCLALALAKEFPDAHVYGTDTSEIALGYARRNADTNGINNVIFWQGDLFEPLYGRENPAPAFDLIISNPPYIRSDDIGNLQPEIKLWEPLSALDGGADGLDHYRRIIPEARQFLKSNGMLMLEIGIDCAGAVKKLFEDAGYSGVRLIKDYAGLERVAAGEWSGKTPPDL